MLCSVRRLAMGNRERETPLWLSVQNSDWKLTPEVEDTLSPLKRHDPPRAIRAEEYGIVIPLDLPLGVERDAVITAILVQLREVASLLASGTRPSDTLQKDSPPRDKVRRS
jgi:hypothetical protein